MTGLDWTLNDNWSESGIEAPSGIAPPSYNLICPPSGIVFYEINDTLESQLLRPLLLVICSVVVM